MAEFRKTMAEVLSSGDEVGLALGFHGVVQHSAGFVERRFIDDWNLWALEEGRCVVETTSGRWSVCPGQPFLFIPGTDYSACFLETSRLLYCHFSLTGGVIGRRWISSVGTPGPIPVEGGTISSFSRTLSDHMEGQRLAGTRLRAILADLLLDHCPGITTSPLVELPEVDPRAVLFDYISRNCRRFIAVRELAGLFGLSPDAFSAYLKDSLGTTPRRFMVASRMEIARQVLSYPGQTLKEVAAMVGYLDEFAFAKAFKRHFGVSPGRFARGEGGSLAGCPGEDRVFPEPVDGPPSFPPSR